MTFTGMFAQSPKTFADSGDIEKCSFTSASVEHWFVTNKVLAIDLPIRATGAEEFGGGKVKGSKKSGTAEVARTASHTKQS